VHVNRAHVPGEFTAPRPCQQVIPRKDLPRMPQQASQEVEFARLERNVTPVPRHAPLRRIKRDGAERDWTLGRRLVTAAVASPEHRLDACDEFAHGKRFRQVIVGADLKTDDAVNLFGARGQHDDWNVLQQRRWRTPDCAAHVQAGQPWKHHVEDDQVWRVTSGSFKAGLPVGGSDNLIALFAKAVADTRDDRGFIFDDEDFRSHVMYGTGRGRGLHNKGVVGAPHGLVVSIRHLMIMFRLHFGHKM